MKNSILKSLLIAILPTILLILTAEASYKNGLIVALSYISILLLLYFMSFRNNINRKKSN